MKRAARFLVLVLVLIHSGLAGAATHEVDLGKLEVTRCYLHFMMEEAGGLKKALDADVSTPFKIADKATLHKAAKDDFDPSVYKKLAMIFKDGDAGFDKLIDALAGEEATPTTIAAKIHDQLKDLDLVKDPQKIPLYSVELAPFISLGSGGGVRVNIDRNNRFLNIGYKAGGGTPDEVAKAVKSGRSFGDSPGHKALDASDVFYLKELADYMKSPKEADAFYQTLLDMLTKTDPSGFSKLSDAGQTVATDFTAIYTAELDRHLMTGLKMHPWENDLAEVTFLSAYGMGSGKVMKGGKLVDGHPVDYFGVGQGGSGIGETRRDRQKLQGLVSKAVKDLHPDVIGEIEKYVGQPSNGDVIHQVMLYLNDPKNREDVVKNSSPLSAAVIKFLGVLRSEADAITKNVQTQLGDG